VIHLKERVAVLVNVLRLPGASGVLAALACLRRLRRSPSVRCVRRWSPRSSRSSVALLSEAVLDHLVGSFEVMREQLTHLLALGELPNVTIQLVRNNGRPAGTGGAFVVATMEDRSEVSYLETTVRGITTDDPSDLARLSMPCTPHGPPSRIASSARRFRCSCCDFRRFGSLLISFRYAS
jgi:hypothetical protein